MTNAKHTPGPWVVDDEGKIVGYDYRVICPIVQGWELKASQFPNPCTEEESRKANARLIAAAPDLLAALQEYMKAYPSFRSMPVGAPHSGAREEQNLQIEIENKARAAIAKATKGT